MKQRRIDEENLQILSKIQNAKVSIVHTVWIQFNGMIILAYEYDATTRIEVQSETNEDIFLKSNPSWLEKL